MQTKRSALFSLALPPLSLLAASALSACAGGEIDPARGALIDPTTTTPVTAPAAIDAAPFDVAAAIERARAAFYLHEGQYVAGTSSHRVELSAGELSFYPAHDTAREAARPAFPAAGRPAVERPEVPLLASPTRIEAITPFTVGTRSIERDGAHADAQLGAVRVSDGALRLARGAVTETLRNGADGLEQSWTFAAAPAGHGDLTVTVGVEGMAHVATTATGEHFADSHTGLGARYGHGTFIDARGERTSVPVQWENGALVLRVPAEIVDGAAYPAVLDPVISAEVAIDAPVTGPRGGDQTDAVIAGNGTDAYLLVFVDGLFGENDIRGARFDAMGTLLDSSSFPIALATGTNQIEPAVTWNGTSWIVAWQDGRNGMDWDIYATTVSTTGAVGTAEGAALAATAGVDERTPALASAGSTSLVAYRSGDDETSDVLGLRLNASGVATDAVAFSIGGGAGAQSAAAVAASASQFLVSFEDDADGSGAGTPSVRVRRVSASGTALPDAASTVVATDAFGATVGYGSGTNYVVLWTALDAGFYAVFSGTIPTTGTITAPTRVEISPGAVDRDYLIPQIAWNGSEFLAVYLDAFYDLTVGDFTAFTISARRLTATGATSGAAVDPTNITGDVASPDVSSIGSAFYISYVDFTGESTEVRGTRVTTTVATPAGNLLSSGPNDQDAPAVAFSGTVWGVAWLDFRAGQADAWAATLDSSGAVSGAPVLLMGGTGGQRPTSLAWSGSRFVATIEDVNLNVRGVTMTAAGIVGPVFDLAVSDTLAAIEPAIACGPAAIGCLAAWTQYDPAATVIDTTVRAARIDASTPTVTVGAAANVVVATGDQFDPAVAASSTGFYVVWTDGRTTTDVAVRGTRFLTSASDAGGIVLAGAAGAQAQATVASDGTDFLVAFIDQRGGVDTSDIYLQRVNGSTGAVIGANVAVATSADLEVQPTVGFSGRYLLGWTRSDGTDNWLQASRISTTGTVVDTTPLEVTSATDSLDQPRIVGGAGGRWMLTYRSSSPSVGRIRARLVSDDLSNGATCTAAGDCASGFCVDGVCCATACAGGTADCNACSVAAGGAVDGTCGMIPACGTDAGTDAGMTDGGTMMTDGGTETDGGGPGTDGGTETDAGEGTDAGMTGTDTGTGTDGGGMGTDGGGMGTDAGVGVDAGGTTGGGGGCGCSVPSRSGSAGTASVGALVLGLALIARRKR